MNPVTTTTLVALALLAIAPAVPAQDAPEVDREFNVYIHEPFHLLPERMTVQEGETVRLRVINGNPNPHDLLVCGDGAGASEGPECSDVWGFTTVAGNSESVVVFTASKAGTFEYFCSMLGHKQGGMKGELEVQGSAVTRNESPALSPLALVAAALVVALAGRRALQP